MKLNVFVCVLILAALSLGAEQPRIALSDFTGERERRAQLLEEMEFSLSDASDETKVARIGKLLSADYLAFGQAVEMGEQRWADTLVESLGNYNRIAAFLTGSLLKSLKATVAASTEQKSERKEEKSAEALIAFCQAVDSLDRKDTAAAKQELQKARRMDPGNEAVVYYISKLSGASPRMQVELDLTAEVAPFSMLNSGLWSADHSPLFTNYPGGEGNLDRSSLAALLGLSWRPLSALSIGVSFRLGKYFQSEERLFSDPWVGLHTDGAVSTYWYGILPGQSHYSLTFEGGLVFRSADDKAGADLRVLYSPDTDGYLDTSCNELVSGVMPIVLSAGGSYGFLGRTLVLAARVIAEAYYDDRSGVMLRTIPAVEWWPWEFLGFLSSSNTSASTATSRTATAPTGTCQVTGTTSSSCSQA